jgi:hypothetical protein
MVTFGTTSVLHEGILPGLGWGERPIAWLVDLLGFFAEDTRDEWRDIGPPDTVTRR